MATGEVISEHTYREAGVDIDRGAALVEAIRPLADSTRRPGVLSSVGGFGALFDVRAAGYADPLLVATTDGVGTKLKVAIAVGRFETVGIDLVAMCVNDLLVEGAEPLFFLDYYATPRLDVAAGTALVAGIAAGCRQAGCALIGGETAEMPGLYADGDFDLAGFAVGAVERGRQLDGERAVAGDVILGLASSGLHSNGFSLVRRLVAATGGDYRDAAPFEPERPLGEALLTPTRIYVGAGLAALRATDGGIRAMAHITGGGLLDNLPRVLPAGLAAAIDATRWPLLPVFDWLARTGRLDHTEMARTFNCGIGLALIVAAEAVSGVRTTLEAAGERVYEIGRLVPRAAGEAGVRLSETATAWPS